MEVLLDMLNIITTHGNLTWGTELLQQHVPDNVKVALQLCPHKHSTWLAKHCYTDGSVTNQELSTAAWGLVVLGEDAADISYQGYITGMVAETCRTVLPELHATSTDAEFVGVAWALICIIADTAVREASIHTDSLN
eukprot:3269683-Pyramimonas_sp.AAC.1